MYPHTLTQCSTFLFVLSRLSLFAATAPPECLDDRDAYFDGICVAEAPPDPKQKTQRLDSRPGQLGSFADGALLAAIGGAADAARASILLSDGKILAVGRSNNGTNDDFAIARFYPDGMLDTSFDTDGQTTVNLSGGADIAHAVILQTDGKIVVVGRSDQGAANQFNTTVVRLETNGALDTSFKTNGQAINSIVGEENFGRAVALQTDGKILTGGYTWHIGRWVLFVSRLSTDGLLDNTFGSWGGIQLVSALTSATGALAMGLQTDGAIVATGLFDDTDDDIITVRLTANGAFDTTFSTDGRVTTSITNLKDDVGYALTLGTGGLVYIAGKTINGSNDADLALVRYLSDGSLDTTFHTDGKATNAVNAGDEALFGVVLQTNGWPIAAGFTYNGTNNDYLIVRYQSDGTLDTSFMTDGSNTQVIGTSEDTAQSISILDDGYFVVAGRVLGATYDFGITRFQTDGTLAKAGALDLSFATGGKAMTDVTNDDVGNTGKLQTDGKLIMVGNNDADIAIVRFNINGTIDTAFHTDGKNTADLSGADAVYGYAGLDIDMVGRATFCSRDSGWVGYTLRFSTDGSLDTTFNSTGKTAAWITGNGAGIDSTGRFYNTRNGGAAIFVQRTNTDGTVDTSFATDGTTAGPNGVSYGLVIRTDGNVFAGGEDDSGAKKWIIVSYLSSGALDTSFHTDGNVTTAVLAANARIYNLLIKPDGKILATGTATPGAVEFAVGLYFSDGTLDTSFHTDGIQDSGGTSSAYNSVLQPNGRVILGGDGDFQLARFNINGTLDTTFSTDGRETTTYNGAGGVGIVLRTNGKYCITGTVNQTTADNFGVVCYWP